MVARYEQVRAYRFVTRRIVSAMLSGEPETAEQPTRRFALSFFGSLLVGAIVLAVVGIYGFINPSGGTPAENDIVIERETGARFVFVDGRLHPVLNFASALLIAGSPSPKVRTMSHKSLAAVPVGPPVGIRDAPDPPPPARALIGLPWSVCGVRVNGAASAATRLEIGRTPAGGAALGDRAMLVSTSPANDLPLYLLWRDHRLRITERTVLTALELASITPMQVNAALLNSIPAGPDLAAPKLPGQGQPGPKKVNGATANVGTVYRSGAQYYVLTSAGLATIGAVSAKLLLAGGAAPIEINAVQAAAALANGVVVEPEAFPREQPKTRTDLADTTLCSRLAPAAGGRLTQTLALYGPGSEQLTLDASRPSPGTDATLAQQVSLEPGRGALVQTLPGAGAAPTGTVYLITDQGVRYPLRDSNEVKAQQALGYGGSTPTGVPATLLALVPQGPTLDPAAARSFVTGRAAATPSPTGNSPKPTPAQTPSKAPASPGASRSGRGRRPPPNRTGSIPQARR
jgi:type VII secretion protein EccB